MRRALGLTAVLLLALLALAPTASAHVVPASTIQLDVGERAIVAAVGIPVSDMASATGLDLGDGSAVPPSHTAAIRQYLLAHFAPTGDDGRAWSVGLGPLTVRTTGNASTTGRYQELETTFTLTPPAGGGDRSFNLGYDAVVDRVATHVVIVTVRSDTRVNYPYAVGTISRNTVTNTVQPLHVDLGTGREYRGFASMVTLGREHIREGTDHQLFLLALLLPAPLLATGGAAGRRWSGAVPVRRAAHRIATITLAFTLGHSATLALGAMGVPVPQQLVEALIAVSILVAAVHAIRPLFPGREALVAAGFGLVHGLAFSEALRALHLTGGQLLLSLAGFNLGIEAMQLAIVAIVLPPLILLARTGRYRTLRIAGAAITAVAAAGWLAARLGSPNAVADLADRTGIVAVPAVLGLWLFAVLSAGYALGWRPWSPSTDRWGSGVRSTGPAGAAATTTGSSPGRRSSPREPAAATATGVAANSP